PYAESRISPREGSCSRRGWGGGWRLGVAGLREDGAGARGLDELGVLTEHALGELRGQRLPALAAGGELGVVHELVERLVRDVEPDPVAAADEGDGAGVDGLGRDVADARTGGPAGEPAVGEEQDVL